MIAATTVYFIYFMMYHMAIFTNFFDLYPPNHPYIRLYTKYREMFGTANVVLLTVEVKDGDILTTPETIQKVDRITLEKPAVRSGGCSTCAAESVATKMSDTRRTSSGRAWMKAGENHRSTWKSTCFWRSTPTAFSARSVH